MSKFIPHAYQEVAKKFVLDNKASGLFLDMGLRQNRDYIISDRRFKK